MIGIHMTTIALVLFADPAGPGTGSYRTYRGGGFDVDATFLAIGPRIEQYPISSPSLGFRLVMTSSQ